MRKHDAWARLLLVVMAGFVLLAGGWYSFVGWHYRKSIVPLAQAPAARVAIVFGALVYPGGRLSPMLQDRVETAVQLYHAGKVEKLILSGDNRFVDYDEPGAMMAYAESRGVPLSAMQPDYGGRRTYDTCYRAKAIFGLTSAILVTQEFHLPRALFTCQQLGVRAIGVAADLQPYGQRALAWSTIREAPARLTALLDVIRRQPPPVMGEPIAVFQPPT